MQGELGAGFMNQQIPTELDDDTVKKLTGSPQGVQPGAKSTIGAQDTMSYIQGGGELLGGLMPGGSMSQTLGGLGTIAGTIFGGPLGGAAGGVIGSLLGGLFGPKHNNNSNIAPIDSITRIGPNFDQSNLNHWGSVNYANPSSAPGPGGGIGGGIRAPQVTVNVHNPMVLGTTMAEVAANISQHISKNAIGNFQNSGYH